jgi:hypothetical protein
VTGSAFIPPEGYAECIRERVRKLEAKTDYVQAEFDYDDLDEHLAKIDSLKDELVRLEAAEDGR